MTDKKNKTLFYLDELSGYKVDDDYSDVRDWEVKGADNRIVGKVDGLLVNKNAERVVYLVVEVDKDVIEAGHETYSTKASEGVHGFLNEDGENHLIVPIGMVNLDTENKLVLAPEINYETFAKTQRFKKGNDLNRNYELTVYKSYLPATIDDEQFLAEDEASFYKRKEFENRRKQS